MNKLYTTAAAIKYLREQTGAMSLKVFTEEVRQGRIPEKPYGRTVRFRKEDLDRWQKTSKENQQVGCRSVYTKSRKQTRS